MQDSPYFGSIALGGPGGLAQISKANNRRHSGNVCDPRYGGCLAQVQSSEDSSEDSRYSHWEESRGPAIYDHGEGLAQISRGRRGGGVTTGNTSNSWGVIGGGLAQTGWSWNDDTDGENSITIEPESGEIATANSVRGHGLAQVDSAGSGMIIDDDSERDDELSQSSYLSSTRSGNLAQIGDDDSYDTSDSEDA